MVWKMIFHLMIVTLSYWNIVLCSLGRKAFVFIPFKSFYYLVQFLKDSLICYETWRDCTILKFLQHPPDLPKMLCWNRFSEIQTKLIFLWKAGRWNWICSCVWRKVTAVWSVVTCQCSLVWNCCCILCCCTREAVWEWSSEAIHCCVFTCLLVCFRHTFNKPKSWLYLKQ